MAFLALNMPTVPTTSLATANFTEGFFWADNATDDNIKKE
jgi:hypothetical protein